MLNELSKTLFAKHIGERFRVLDGAIALDAELIEVVGPDSGTPRPFSLLFRAPMEPALPQATYRLEHDRLGPFALFIVPIGPDRERGHMLYEAVFN